MSDEPRNEEQSTSPEARNDAVNGEVDRRPIRERFAAVRSSISASVDSLMSAFTRTVDAGAGRVDHSAEANALGIDVRRLDEIYTTNETFSDMREGSERFRADDKNKRWFFI